MCRFLSEAGVLDATTWLSGGHLLFTEQLKHLGPWEAWLCSVSPVSRQQITKGKGGVKVEE